MSPSYLRALVPLLLVAAARAQTQLEWDHDLQVAAPEKFVMGSAYADAHGGWYLSGSRAVLVSNPGYPDFWQTNTPILWRFDAQGVATSMQDLAPSGTDHYVPDFAVDASGGLVATNVPTATSVLRLDASGAQMWAAPIPVQIEGISLIGFAPNGDVIAGGFRVNSAPNLAAIGWNATGAQTFLQTSPNPNMQGAICALAADGTLALASASNLFNPGSVVVYHADGSLAWSVATPVYTEIEALAFSPAGGLVSAGDVYASGPLNTRHAQVLAWDSSGAPTWSWTDASNDLSRLFAVSVSADGFVAVAGDGFPHIPGADQAFLALFDASGTLRWTRLWSGVAGQYGDVFQQVLFRASGDIVAGGITALNDSSTNSQRRTAPSVACFSRDGLLAWQYVGASVHNGEDCRSLQETPAGSIVLASASVNFVGQTTVPGGRFLSLQPQANGFCFGDGTGTPCPCGNTSAQGAGSGCLNSLGLAAHLGATGNASLTGDTLVLHGSGMTNSTALYFQGTTQENGGAGAVFGDGKRCAGGSIVRLGLKTNVAGTSQFPAHGDPPIHVAGSIGSSGVRTYQAWYRNPAAFCTPDTFNFSNGVEVSWGP
jgi:hypothetical protein